MQSFDPQTEISSTAQPSETKIESTSGLSTEAKERSETSSQQSPLNLPEWRELFSALLNDNNFSLSEDEKSFRFRSTDQKLVERFISILDTPTKIKSGLRYKLVRTDAPADTSISASGTITYPPVLPLTSGSEVRILNQLVSTLTPDYQQTLIGLPWRVSDQGFLIAPLATPTPLLIRKRRIEVELLHEAFASLSYAQYRFGIAENATMPPITDSKAPGHLSAEFIKEIFSVDDKGTLICKFRPFYQALVPPQPRSTTTTESEITYYEAEVPKQHFQLYLTTSVSEPFVFGTTPEGKPYPIFLPSNDSSSALYRPVQYHVALDCSSSMGWNQQENEDSSIFPEALAATSKVVSKISESTADGDSLSLHLIQSPGAPLISQKYSIHEDKELKNCLTFLREQKADGSTNLYGVMVNIFDKIAEDSVRIPNARHVVVVISDGKDQNTSEMARLWGLIQAKCAEYARLLDPPKFYTLTIARNLKDKQLIELLQTTTGAKEIEVSDGKQIAELENYIHQFRELRKLINIIISASDTVRNLKIPVFSDRPTLLRDLVLSPTDSVTVDGVSYVAALNPPVAEAKADSSLPTSSSSELVSAPADQPQSSALTLTPTATTSLVSSVARWVSTVYAMNYHGRLFAELVKAGSAVGGAMKQAWGYVATAATPEAKQPLTSSNSSTLMPMPHQITEPTPTLSSSNSAGSDTTVDSTSSTSSPTSPSTSS